LVGCGNRVQIVEPAPPRRSAGSLEILKNADRSHDYSNHLLPRAKLWFPLAINAGGVVVVYRFILLRLRVEARRSRPCCAGA